MLITDVDGRITYVNPALERRSGYAAADLLGKSPRVLSAETLPDSVYQDIWRRLEAGVSRRSTFTNRTRTGEVYEEDTSISVVKDATGEITGFVWVGQPAEHATSVELFRRLTESSPSGVVIMRGESIFFVNEQFKRYSGYSDSELAGLDPSDLVHADDQPAVLKARALADSTPHEYRLVARDGTVKWVLESMTAVDFLGLGNAEGAYRAANVVDITDRKAAEEQLQYALTLYAATVESTTDGILVVDMDRNVRQMNSRLRELWGLPPEAAEYVGRNGAALFWQMVSQTRDPERFTLLGRHVHYSGEGSNDVVELLDGRILEVQTNPQIIDGAVAGQVWSFRDVTQRERSQANLAHLASLDSLTALPSRRRFQEEVNATISRGEQGAVLFMDVDDFKAINDSFGHSAGDDLLRSLAVCLSQGLREGDLLARLGGDEFAVLLRRVTRSQAAAVAQRMLRAVRAMKVVSADHPVSSTISIGGALFPAHGTSVDELLGHADLAMYSAKGSGRNRFQLYHSRQDSRSSSISRVMWKQRILEALENDRFTLYAQPIFELSTGRLGCYELLLRMRDGAGRLVQPDRFLPAAERSGLMHEIDAWVVRHGLAIGKQLAEAPQPVKVSINLSATAIGNNALLDLIKRESSLAGLDPEFVTFEVTETALIGDIQKARVFFKALKDMGFRISLDDFGAGFSSFSRLKQVPADYLKIDGSFVKNITRNARDRHFVKAIADLASGLGIGAVAEWVEDAEAVDILIGLGVLNGQGFYLGVPQPIARILDAHLKDKAAA